MNYDICTGLSKLEQLEKRDRLRANKEKTTRQKHTLAITMIEVVYVSDEHGVEIQFSI